MKLRVTIWMIVIATMAMVIIQNRDFYLQQHVLQLNLIITSVELPPIANVTHHLFFFLAGIVLACISLYHERFQMRRQIKKLNTAFQSCAQQVSEMKPSECTRPPKKRMRLPEKWRRKKTNPDAVGQIADDTDTLPEKN